MKKTHLILITLFFSVLLVSGCTKPKQTDADKLNIMVSILPQIDFVERIGGDQVTVTAMIPPGFSPATYNPSPEQIQKLSEADIYIRIGHIPLEKAQMSKLQDLNPDMVVVDSSIGVDLRNIESHSHGEEDEYHDEHEEEQKETINQDPHIWLNPNLVKIQAENIYQALIKASPENTEYFETNKNKFLSDLENLDLKLKEAFQPISEETILVFHPAFGYLADAYNFHQEAIEIEGKDPTIENIQKIIDESKKDNIKVIFVQKQFSTQSAQVIAEAIEGTVVQIDPLAQNYFENMENMAQIITTNLK